MIKKYYLFILLILLLPVVYAIPTDWCTYQSPMMALRLTADANDCSGNGRNMANTGVTFNGTDADFESSEGDFLNYGNATWMDIGTGDFTICANISRESVSASPHIFQRWNGNDDTGFRMFHQLSTVNLQFSGVSHEFDISGAGLEHSAICFRKNNSVLYIFNYTTKVVTDVLGGVGNITPVGTQNLTVGRKDGTANAYFDGQINSLVVWNTALTDSQISYVWGAGTTLNLTTETTNTNNIENDISTFNMSFNNASLVHTNSTADFVYNNTHYPATDSGIGFSVSLHLPIINTTNSTSFNYYWSYNLTYQNGTITQGNTTTQTQTVYRIKITNDCTSLTTTKTINFSFKDEVSNSFIPTDVEVAFTTYSQNSSFTRYDSFTFSGITNKTFCISPSTASYSSDITTSYSSSGYGSREWIKTGYGLSSTTKYETLYSLSTTNQTTVIVHVSDNSDNPISNARVELERWDLPLNDFSLVEVEVTNSEGEARFEYDTTAFYRFKIYQNDILKTTTTKFKITATDLYYKLSDSADSSFIRGILVRLIDSNLTYNYNTNTLNFIWNDQRQVASLICFNLTASNSTTHIYGYCSTSHSGSQSYVLNRANISYSAYSYGVHTDGGQYTMNTLSIEGAQLWQGLGEDSTFMAILIILALGLIGAANAVIGLFLIAIALFMVWSLELAFMSQLGYTGLLFAEGILLFIMLKRER